MIEAKLDVWSILESYIAIFTLVIAQPKSKSKSKSKSINKN